MLRERVSTFKKGFGNKLCDPVPNYKPFSPVQILTETIAMNSIKGDSFLRILRRRIFFLKK